MGVRDMKGDPSIWERLAWGDLSSQEKELWGVLGWRQEKWDRNEAPASTNKEWRQLSSQEQAAAMGLGFTEAVWDGFEDQ